MPKDIKVPKDLKDEVVRAIRRIAHEILEGQSDSSYSPFVIMGLQHGGVWIAEALVAEIQKIAPDAHALLGSIDVSMYRDDIALRPTISGSISQVPCNLDGILVVLVDDVLFTGRTVRAALDAIIEYGRPQAVRLAVLVDRGHRELPIRPDYVGKNIPTHISDEVSVSLEGITILSGASL